MRKWWPLVAVCLGSLMLLIDVTIVNVALPDMSLALSTSFGALQWVIDAYALVLAALLLGAGGLADVIGHRRVYLAGLVVFAAASLTCGLAPNAATLIAARAVQGAGAAAMFATTFALLNASYAGKDRGIAYGMWGAVSGAAAAIGPVVGGLLTELIDWRWIFFVNVPIAAGTIAMTLTVLAADRPHAGRRVDVPGTVTFAACAATLTIALIRANDDGWTAPSTLALFVVSALALAGFVFVESRGRDAMFALSLLRSRGFVGVLVAALLVNVAAFAALTYASIWLQSVLGLSPIEAGLVTLPASLAGFVTSALLGRLLHRATPGPLIGGGLLVIAAGAFVEVSCIGTDASWPALLPGLFLVGIGVGLSIPTLSSAGMAAVEHSRAGMAAGVINTARQLGFALGIAALGAVFAARIGSYLSAHGAPAGLARAIAGGQSGRLLAASAPDRRATLDHVIHGAAASGLGAAFLAAAITGVVAGVAVLALTHRPRHHRDFDPAAAVAGAGSRQRMGVPPAMKMGVPPAVGA